MLCSYMADRDYFLCCGERKQDSPVPRNAVNPYLVPAHDYHLDPWRYYEHDALCGGWNGCIWYLGNCQPHHYINLDYHAPSLAVPYVEGLLGRKVPCPHRGSYR